MLKNSLLVAAAALVIGLSSCKKNYTCECKDSNGSVTSVTYKETKSKAKEACDLMDANYAGGSCSIK